MQRLSKLVGTLLVVIIAFGSGWYPRAAAQNSGERSLGDVARELRESREKRRPDIQVTESDAKEFFSSVDEILGFASKDTGFPKRGSVKHRLVGRDHVRNMVSDGLGSEAQEKLAGSELVLKKLGLLPADFTLRDFLIKNTTRDLAGYYSLQDQTMYLLNWVPLELQRSVMAHELTHALQDQNYGLTKFNNVTLPRPAAGASGPVSMMEDTGEARTARLAVIEGQAMVVFVDYFLKPTGLTVATSTTLQDAISIRAQSYDMPLKLHGAPRVLKESTMFPYREGLTFEIELLRSAGRATAFAGVFSRPPVNTHQILHPDEYLAKTATPHVSLPDFRPVLGADFEAIDRGMMGELDARIMALEFGRENDLYTVAATWNGGGYIAFKRAGARIRELTPKDISLVYVSRWKTAKAAKRFAHIYKASLVKREPVQNEQLIDNTDCESSCGGVLWLAKLITTQGSTNYLEILPDNTVLIAQGFAEETMPKLRQLIATSTVANLDALPLHELTLSLYESADFLAFHAALGDEWRQSLVAAAQAAAPDPGRPPAD